MQVGFPSVAAAHRPDAAGPGRGGQASTADATTTPATTPETPSDTISLSAQAQKALADDAYDGKSPAFLARAALSGAGAESLAGTSYDLDVKNFGQLVRQFTPGHLQQAAAAEIEDGGDVEETGETVAVEETEEAGETAPEEGDETTETTQTTETTETEGALVADALAETLSDEEAASGSNAGAEAAVGELLDELLDDDESDEEDDPVA